MANNAVTLPKLAPGTAAGQLLQWNGTAWVFIDQTALTLAEEDGIIGNEIINATDATLVRAGAGTAASPYTLDVGAGQITSVELANNAVTLPKLASGTASGQLLRWNGTAWVLVDQTALTLTEVDGIIGNEILNATDATLVRAGAGTVANPYTLDVGAGQITSAELADNAITSAKIIDASILGIDLNQMGAVNNQVLKWNGATWAPAADAGGTAYLDGNGLTLTGNTFDVDPLAGEVTGPTNATLIANDAVTTAKIANAAILGEDINQMGAINDQVLKWNGATGPRPLTLAEPHILTETDLP